MPALRPPLWRSANPAPRQASRLRTFAAKSFKVEAKLIVRGLPRLAGSADVRKHFARFRSVSDVVVPVDRKDGGSMKFAFVTLDAADAEEVRDLMHKSILNGRQLEVELADTAVAKPPRPHLGSDGRISAANEINKRLVSRSTAGGILSLFEESQFSHNNFATALQKLGVLSNTFEAAQKQALIKLLRRTAASVQKDHKWLARDLVNACWGAAKLGVGAPELFSAVSIEAQKKMGTFDAQALANMVWAYATAGVQAPALFESAAAESIKEIATFKAQELANTAWAYAKAGFEAPFLFEAVAVVALETIETFDSPSIATTAWAFAKAQIEAPFMFEALAAKAVVQIAAFAPRDLATVAWAFSTAQKQKEGKAPQTLFDAQKSLETLFDAVALESVQKMSDFAARDLSTLAWAFSTAGIEAPLLFQAIGESTQQIIQTFDSQSLANTLWAFSRARVFQSEFFEAIARQALQKLDTFNAEALATTAWAYSEAFARGLHGPQSRALLAGVADEARARLEASLHPTVFEPWALSTLAQAFSRLPDAAFGSSRPAFFAALACAAIEDMIAFSPRDVATVVSAFSTAQIDAPQLYEAAASAAFPALAMFEARSLAALACAFAKAPRRTTRNFFTAIGDEATRRADSMEAKHVANVVWAFAAARVDAPDLFEAFAKAAAAKIQEFDAQGLANVAWAYSTAGIEAPALFKAIAAAALRPFADAGRPPFGDGPATEHGRDSRLGADGPAGWPAGAPLLRTFKAAELSMLAWAYARADLSPPQLFDAIAAQGVLNISNFGAQELANISWAIAKVGSNEFHTASLFEAVAVRANSQIVTFHAQELANIAWAFAKMGVEAPLLFDAIAKEAGFKLDTFSGQHLANTVWAYATAAHEAPQLFEAIASTATSRITDLHARELAATCWAFSKAGISAPQLFQAIASEALMDVGAFEPMELTMLAWAFSTAGARDGQGVSTSSYLYSSTVSQLFDDIADECRYKMTLFNAQELATLAWAFAKARVEAPGLFKAIGVASIDKIDDFTSQGLAMALWAFHSADVSAPALFEAIEVAGAAKLERGYTSADIANTLFISKTLPNGTGWPR
mmetsp:Transcript_28688/g.98998  ORF Transcript_28688/g.98998 Transcript_28688/m.98998 type:complete len:1089 (+) Transcript_28688:200-3466(+)